MSRERFSMKNIFFIKKALWISIILCCIGNNTELLSNTTENPTIDKFTKKSIDLLSTILNRTNNGIENIETITKTEQGTVINSLKKQAAHLKKYLSEMARSEILLDELEKSPSNKELTESIIKDMKKVKTTITENLLEKILGATIAFILNLTDTVDKEQANKNLRAIYTWLTSDIPFADNIIQKAIHDNIAAESFAELGERLSTFLEQNKDTSEFEKKLRDTLDALNIFGFPKKQTRPSTTAKTPETARRTLKVMGRPRTTGFPGATALERQKKIIKKANTSDLLLSLINALLMNSDHAKVIIQTIKTVQKPLQESEQERIINTVEEFLNTATNGTIPNYTLINEVIDKYTSEIGNTLSNTLKYMVMSDTLWEIKEALIQLFDDIEEQRNAELIAEEVTSDTKNKQQQQAILEAANNTINTLKGIITNTEKSVLQGNIPESYSNYTSDIKEDIDRIHDKAHDILALLDELYHHLTTVKNELEEDITANKEAIDELETNKESIEQEMESTITEEIKQEMLKDLKQEIEDTERHKSAIDDIAQAIHAIKEYTKNEFETLGILPQKSQE